MLSRARHSKGQQLTNVRRSRGQHLATLSNKSKRTECSEHDEDVDDVVADPVRDLSSPVLVPIDTSRRSWSRAPPFPRLPARQTRRRLPTTPPGGVNAGVDSTHFSHSSDKISLFGDKLFKQGYRFFSSR